MSYSEQKHKTVSRFVLHLCNEEDDAIWEQIDKLSKVDYEAAMSILVRIAKSHGFTFLKEDWERVVKKIIEAYPDQRNNRNCDIIELLRKPTKEHSKELKEYVFEICDYEGDPSWGKEKDYRFRVDYVIEALQNEMENDDSGSLLHSCSQEQLDGKGWIPGGFGISCCTGHFQTTINWRDIKDSLSFLLDTK
jgi:hypothetical protein